MKIRLYTIWFFVAIIVALTIVSIYSGINFLGIKTNSYLKIKEADQTLTGKIEELEKVKNVDFLQAQQRLEDETKSFNQTKETYLSKIEAAKEAGAKEGVVLESYDIEFLWAIIGRYATSQDLKLTLEVKEGRLKEEFETNKKFKPWDLNFTVQGEYGDIIEFIYKLEKDEKISARISDFSIENGPKVNVETVETKNGEEKGRKTEVFNGLTAKFVVKSVPITTEGFDPAISGKTTVDPYSTDQARNKNGERRPGEQTDPRVKRPEGAQTSKDPISDIANEANEISNRGNVDQLKNEAQKYE